MLNILQRYTLRELAAPFAVSLLFFSFVMLLRNLFRMAELLLEARVGWETILSLMGIITVSLTILTVPMAALLGCLIGFGRLTAENEILAMRAAGISLWRIFYPVFVLALVGSGILMWFGFDIMPRMVKSLTDRQTQIQFELLTKLEPGRNYENLAPKGSDISLYFDSVDESARSGQYSLPMKKVAMRVIGEPAKLAGSSSDAESSGRKQESIIFAEKGTIVGDLATRSVTVVLENGTLEPVDRRAAYQQTQIVFRKLEKSISPETDDLVDDEDQPRRMVLSELLKRTAAEPDVPFAEGRKMPPAWRSYLNARNELFQRLSLPLSLLAFVMIAVPLAVELRPTAKSVSIVIAILLILLYYVLLQVAARVGMSNSPLTFLAYMSPNIVIGGAGLWLFWRSQS